MDVNVCAPISIRYIRDMYVADFSVGNASANKARGAWRIEDGHLLLFRLIGKLK